MGNHREPITLTLVTPKASPAEKQADPKTEKSVPQNLEQASLTPSARKNTQQSRPDPMQVAKKPVVAEKVVSRKVKTVPKIAKVTPEPAPLASVSHAMPVPGSPPVANGPDKISDAQFMTVDREKQQYLAALRARIERGKFYPLVSRRRGEEGKIVIGFVIRKNGELTDLTVIKSSGVRRLDNAALKTLRKITPFKPIPGILMREKWGLSVPIIYDLQE